MSGGEGKTTESNTLCEKEGINGSRRVANKCTKPTAVFNTTAHAGGSSLYSFQNLLSC